MGPTVSKGVNQAMVDVASQFPEAISPWRWGAAVDYDTKDWRPYNWDKWIVHWGGGSTSTAGRDEYAILRAWERFHLSKGWRGIAYNMAIGNSGRLYRLRGDNQNGATRGDEEPDGIPENREGFAVVFLVNKPDQVSEAALNTFRGMYAKVLPDLSKVVGHRMVAEGPGWGTATSCPGPQLYEWIKAEGYKQEPTGGDEGMWILGLKEGSKGDDVRTLQRIMLRIDPDILPEWGDDGDYGGETVAAVKKLAAPYNASGLSVNSVVAEWLMVLHTRAVSGVISHNHDDRYAKITHHHSIASHSHTVTGTAN